MPKPESRPALNPDRLAELRSFGGADFPELAREVAELFLGLADASVNDLAVAVKSGDALAVGFQAHRFRGSAGNVGAEVLSELLSEIEQQAKQGAIALEDQVAALRGEVIRVVVALREEFKVAA